MSRVIKKYPNRRLYDTEESRYITMADVRNLVMNDVAFSVVDKKSGDDITRNILLQVISEQELNGDPILSEAFLEQVIRAHGTVASGFLARHLEKSLTSYLAQQNQVLESVQSAVNAAPGPALSADRQKAG
ncbi:MAG: polyhydroxyalkanoate synthesis repressor PhaR [Woeseiaceae bacterium]|nr:polyhydroxyalkanoate synthesis repressor PhaR [Woeseiaceae bacterium]